MRHQHGTSPPQAYNDIKGRWSMQDKSFVLSIEHVQADPYASPSNLSVEVCDKQIHFS